ncbi:MAG: hypothetical protein EXR51_03705 [Dehalococcoidia bacterium]|nr:hypothetical protein [Dehalococcoidia bacterium]
MMFEPRQVNQLRVTIEGIDYAFHEDFGGQVVGTVVKYPSCQAFGTSLEDALDAVQDTLLALLEEMEGMGGTIPDDLHAFLDHHRGRSFSS